MGSPANAPQPVPAWFQYEQGLPQDLPDSARDALRDRFFNENVAPGVLQAGYGLEPSRKAFMDATERPTKATFPRAEAIGKTALAHATAPIAGLLEAASPEDAGKVAVQQAESERRAQAAMVEAQRQGMATWPLGMAGAALGEAPYWMGPLKAAKVAGTALEAGRVAQLGLNMAAGAVAQGTYDAAKAQAGNRMLDGAKGALMGAGTVGVLEGVPRGAGAIWHALTSKGIEPEAATAIESLAKGQVPEEGREANTAAEAMVQNPQATQAIQEQVAKSEAAAKSAGMPTVMQVGRTDGRVRVDVRGADGNLYRVGGTAGFKFEELRAPKFAQNLADHLDNGGNIEAVYGDPSVMQQFNSMVEEARAKSGALDLQLPETAIQNDEAKGVTATLAPGETMRFERRYPDITSREPQEEPKTSGNLVKVWEGGQVKAVMMAPADIRISEAGMSENVPEDYMTQLRQQFPDASHFEFLSDTPETRKYLQEKGTWTSTGEEPRFEFGPRTAVPSSSLDTLQYDPDTQALQVKFKSGTTYQYEGVPEDEYRALLMADSKGKYFAQNIKGKYDYAMLESERPDYRDAWVKKHLEKGLVRGSSDLPLSDEGQDHANELAARFAAKGGLDELHSADLTRHLQTADAIERTNSPLVRHPPDPDLQSMKLGALEGMPHDEAIGTVNDLMRNAPNTAMPGAGPLSTSPGESYNQFTQRILPKIKAIMDSSEARPERKIGAVVSSRDIGAVKAWLDKGAPADYSTDVETMTKMHEMPGDVYRLAKDEEGAWNLRKVDMDADADLKPGAYLIRHAETPWNAQAAPEVYKVGEEEPIEEPRKLDPSQWLEVGQEARYKETPLARRIHGPVPMLEELGAKGAAISRFAGEKPTLIYGQDADKGTLFHENLHGHFGYLGIRDDVQSALGESKIANDLVRNDETLRSYGEGDYTYPRGDQLEEAYVHAATAVRTGDVMRLQELADADTDMDTVLDWTKEVSDQVKSRVAELPDSLHKRTLERRMDAVISRATKSLDDVTDIHSTDGTSLNWAKGRYMVLERGGTTKFFDDKETMLKYLEDEHGQPLNVPELVDDSLLPDHLPRLSRSMPGPSTLRAPITTDPPPPELTPDADGKLSGFSLIGRFFRPFYSWLGDVSQQLKRPDLWDAFSKFDKDQVAVNNFVRPYAQVLRDTLYGSDLKRKYAENRLHDFYRYFEADPKDRAAFANEFRFSPSELQDMQTLQEKFFDPLSQELGLDADWYIRNFAPRIRGGGYDPNELFPRGPQTNVNTEFFPEKVRTGELDPKDSNLLRVAGTYLRLGARQKFLGDDLKAAAELVDELNPDGSYRLGLLQPQLKRHLEYLRGTPDYTSRMVNAIAATAIDKMNGVISAVNEHLPGGMQLEHIEATPGEEMSKLILMSYAGELALRPALLARDAAQYFLTTLPVLGNYTWTGLRRVFGYAREGEGSDWYKIPQQYGALIDRSDLQTMISQSGETEPVGRWERFAQKALGMIQWTHNTNRVAAFWGHDAMAQDALENFLSHGNTKQLARESGMWFMDKSMRDQFTKEAQMLTRGDDLTDISHRIAKEMVELSQWNFKRGANPGIYEYQLGRLFGQYGTWPLNYIEYARRFAKAEDKGAAIGGLVRLGAAHGAMLEAGAAFGVDTANWTFTQPMAYGGGPALNVLTSIPQAMDFESQRGSEARSEIRRTFFPGIIPGGAAFETVGNAIRNDDPHFWMRLLGFTPLEEREQVRGWHQMVP